MRHCKTLVLGLAALAASCSSSPFGGGDGGGGDNCGGSFGETAAARKIETFVQASAAFTSQANELNTSIRDACKEMGRKLNVPDAELSGDNTQTICNRVATEISSRVRSIRGMAGATLHVAYAAPVCKAEVSAYSQCVGRCDANVMPGMAPMVTCTGGELRGGCSGMCTGSCSAEVSAMCTGACEGTCSGSCTGTCNGACDGTCTARDASGNCMGTCTGTCRGTCSAGCTGTCMGSCVTMAAGSCMGECRGMCSVEFTEPVCTGRPGSPPTVDAECSASCEARASARAECNPPEVTVQFAGSLSAEGMAQAMQLKEALEGNFGKILAARQKLERLVVSGQAVLTASAGLSSSAMSVSVQAATCVAQATNALRAAVPQVMGSVSVSVQVSGSVSGSSG